MLPGPTLSKLCHYKATVTQPQTHPSTVIQILGLGWGWAVQARFHLTIRFHVGSTNRGRPGDCTGDREKGQALACFLLLFSRQHLCTSTAAVLSCSQPGNPVCSCPGVCRTLFPLSAGTSEHSLSEAGSLDLRSQTPSSGQEPRLQSMGTPFQLPLFVPLA